jgi:hypothetical protein
MMMPLMSASRAASGSGGACLNSALCAVGSAALVLNDPHKAVA